MEPKAQAKVLRAIEEKEIERLGESKARHVDVRLLAATNKDIKKEIEEGRFREDLYYRLHGLTIEVPPLRQRKEDIRQLSEYFIEQFCEANNIRLKPLSKEAESALMEYDWPGNVRELKHCIENMIVLTDSETITDQDVINLFQSEDHKPSLFYSLTWSEAKKKFEKSLIKKRLVANDWNVTKTAETFKMERTHLSRKIREYRIKKSNRRKDDN